MTLALRLARRGEGLVEPNPMVGCVIAAKGRTIGQGYHRRFGAPHAEVAALRSCSQSPRGATVYCSLEPCSHIGKTPPCVDALIAARVARVVIPTLDPNPEVNGRGVALLRKAGIKVEIGLLAEEAARMLRPFATRHTLGRPYVIAKWAQSFNGQLIAPSSESRWISCPESRKEVHRLRARMDAIIVGAGTAISDDPLLTAREVPLRRVAMRWVVDGRLRTPVESRLVRTAVRYPTFVFTTVGSAKSRKATALGRAGVEVIVCKSRHGRIDLNDLLHMDLFAGVTNLLVEGGPTLLNQFFAGNLVDEAQVYVAPKFIAGDARQIRYSSRPPGDVRAESCGTDVRYTLLYENFIRRRDRARP